MIWVINIAIHIIIMLTHGYKHGMLSPLKYMKAFIDHGARSHWPCGALRCVCACAIGSLGLKCAKAKRNCLRTLSHASVVFF